MDGKNSREKLLNIVRNTENEEEIKEMSPRFRLKTMKYN
jgi:hypothetical protein